MKKTEKQILEAGKKAKQFIALLDDNGYGTVKSAKFFKKYKSNPYFVVFANLAQGVSKALANNQKVVIEVRENKKLRKPKITKVFMPSQVSKN